MRTGIIGLPQSGKTTLFRILTRAHLDARAAHAQVHVGVATVPDHRLDKLAELFHPRKTTHAQVEYVDVAGLTGHRAHSAERSKEAAYLSELRLVDALAHVVRLFEHPAVPHPRGSLDALRDIQDIELELMLSDLDQITRRAERIEKDLKKRKDPALEHELALLARCRQALEAERPLRELPFTVEEEKALSGFKFLSQKPVLYVLNLGDEEAPEINRAAAKHKLSVLAGRPGTAVVPVAGRIEAELAELEGADAEELMRSYGLEESGRDRVIRATYELLGLISFFTVGEVECRAWTARRGTTAVKAAGIVHSDLERGFIRAEVARWDDLVAGGGWAGAREQGKVRLEGREYVVADGDVLHIRHSG
jgi:GTP-binding protein YchF